MTLSRGLSGTTGSESPADVSLEQSLHQVVLLGQDSQEVLLTLSRILGEAFEVDCCLVVPLSRDQTVVEAACWWTRQSAQFIQKEHELLQLLSHSALATSMETPDGLALSELPVLEVPQPFAASSTSKQKMTGVKVAQPPVYRSLLLGKTWLHGRVNGLIGLLRSQPYDWKEQDIQMLNTLSPQVAIAISQAQLEQQVQRQIRYQALSDRLTTAIRNGWALSDVFDLAVEGAVSTLQINRGMLLLFKYVDPLYRGRSTEPIPEAKVTIASEYPPNESSESQPLVGERSEAIDGPTERWLNQSFWASDCSLCQQILTQAVEAILLPLAEDDSRNPRPNPVSEAAPVFELAAFPTQLLMPLENQGTVLGCLVLQQAQQRFWTPEELSFVKLVTAQLSTAIIQSRTLQQIQALVNERTTQLQRSLEVQAKLYEKTRQQVDQLRKLNEERETFLSTVSHELLTPLTSMRLAIRMLRQADLTPDRSARYLDILEQQCTQETKLINDMLALRKLESNPAATAQFHKLDLKFLIRDLAFNLAESWSDKDLELVVDLPTQPLSIYTDPDSLNRIVVELLTNAKKYSAPGTTLHLKVFHEVQPQMSQVVLSLSSVGFGISPEEQPYIFEKFRRGEWATKQAIQGTGLGLALVKGLVGHLNGAIAVTSEPMSQGPAWCTCFTVTLPQYPERVILAGPL